MRLAVIVAIVICGSVTRTSSSFPALGYLSDQDRKVIAAVLDTLEPGAFDVLLDSTIPVCRPRTETSCIRRVVLDTVKASTWRPVGGTALRNIFIVRNTHPLSLISLRVRVPLADGTRIRNRSANWQRVFSESPRTRHFIQVSAPVYTVDREKAVIYVESVCGGGCGAGYLQLLGRKRGRWVVEQTLNRWTSEEPTRTSRSERS